jgi:hypothetical protein
LRRDFTFEPWIRGAAVIDHLVRDVRRDIFDLTGVASDF